MKKEKVLEWIVLIATLFCLLMFMKEKDTKKMVVWCIAAGCGCVCGYIIGNKNNRGG